MSEDDASPAGRDALLRDARRRLMRLEMETHRIKAVLARIEALAEDEAADALARLLAEHRDDHALATALESYLDEPRPAQSASPLAAPLPVAAIAEAPPMVDGRPMSKEAPQPAKPLLPGKPGVRTAHPSGATAKQPAHHGRPQQRKAKSAATRANRSGHPAQAAADKRRRAWRPSPPWLTSIFVHLLVLFALGLVTFAAMREAEPMLDATVGARLEDDVAELADVEIKPLELDDQSAEPLPLENLLAELEPSLPEQVTEHAESASTTDPTGELAFAELPLAAAALLEAGGGNGEGDAAASGGADAALPSASFFGAEARADRIVFVVDNSNSMDEGRFETALMELARSVDALSPEQSFYVILYSDTAYRLFHPLSEEALVPATRENKQRLQAWLTTVEMCLGGRLVDAMRIAAQLEPQVVYLLSDGVMSEYPVRYLTEDHGWGFILHTVGMTVPDRLAAQNLLAIAEANGGVFRQVGVTPLAREMARRRPIKKNRTRGAVWGIRLPPER